MKKSIYHVTLFKMEQEMQVKRKDSDANKRDIAILMTLHPRLGHESKLKALSVDIIKSIASTSHTESALQCLRDKIANSDALIQEKMHTVFLGGGTVNQRQRFTFTSDQNGQMRISNRMNLYNTIKIYNTPNGGINDWTVEIEDRRESLTLDVNQNDNDNNIKRDAIQAFTEEIEGDDENLTYTAWSGIQYKIEKPIMSEDGTKKMYRKTFKDKPYDMCTYILDVLPDIFRVGHVDHDAFAITARTLQKKCYP